MNIYYILRDRIPVYLSMVWLYRWRLSKRDFLGIPLTELLGYYMTALTGICLALSILLLNAGLSLSILVGFRWSFPSPITWGVLILAGTVILKSKVDGELFSFFESFYISFLSAIAGGWMYEILRGIPYWFRSGFAHWNWYKFNLQKVFLFEFQIFAFPIVLHLLIKRFEYKIKPEMLILLGSVVVFYLLGLQIAPFYHQLGQLGGNTYYSWIMRLPMALLLYTMLDEVGK